MPVPFSDDELDALRAFGRAMKQRGFEEGRAQTVAALKSISALNGSTEAVLGLVRRAFDPSEARDSSGEWTAGRFSATQGATASTPRASQPGGPAPDPVEHHPHVRTLLARVKEVPAAVAREVATYLYGKYHSLTARYGDTGAKAILAAAVLLTPVPLPGTTLIPVALAEAVVRIRRAVTGKGGGVGKAMPGEESLLSPELIRAEAKRLLHELYAGMGEEPPDTPDAADDDPDDTDTWTDPDPVAKAHDVSGEARDEKGEWTTGGAKATPDQFRADHPHATAEQLGDKGVKGQANKKLPDATRPPIQDPETARYLNNYTWGYDGPLNKALRETGAPPPGKFGGDTIARKPDKDGPAMHAALQRLFDAAPPFGPPPIRVYRGVEVSSKVKSQIVAAAKKAQKSGGEFAMPGYISTATGESFPGNVQFEIRAVHGIDTMPYSHFPEERELLLNHNSRFRVKAIEKGDADQGVDVIIHLEQLPPEDRR